jgi:hypothetical protein
MQAILTKYLGPTSSRGARIIAKAVSGSVTIGWDHGLDDAENHRTAAKLLQLKLVDATDKHWQREMVSGCLPDGSYAHVFKD